MRFGGSAISALRRTGTQSIAQSTASCSNTAPITSFIPKASRAPPCPLVRLRQAEHPLGDVAENHVRRDRRDAADQRLAEIALDVILLRVAVAAVRHHRLLARVEARFAG